MPPLLRQLHPKHSRQISKTLVLYIVRRVPIMIPGQSISKELSPNNQKGIISNITGCLQQVSGPLYFYGVYILILRVRAAHRDEIP